MRSKRGGVLGAIVVFAFTLGAAPSAGAAAHVEHAAADAHQVNGPSRPKCHKGDACVYLNNKMVLHTAGDWSGGASMIKADKVINAGEPDTYDRIKVWFRDTKGRNVATCVNRGEILDFRGYVQSIDWVSHC
ncbi:hypothetical protein ABZ820_21250 [Streptomyces diacarni]|uniref:hypothetical protein n=1 Tax=Streptomyces diacarni TaxID=2800381 RepID=UPI0033F6C013